ncbi:hypothetical protein [Aquimarina sp. RZ0]|uniref:hypothetical protein n=1 Tax=Aquimarina sp. RZ0 TaxID=2607730 RepID=UPI0011F09CE2|nr:hypothetical protein [Aquimarina sp. RZ0]KAA1243904.1 hypothetical protein F0000_18755 [Aquimarina sp. RZ0]
MEYIRSLLMLPFLTISFLQAQGELSQAGYIELTSDEYEKISEINKENKLHGNYYIREFSDKKLINIRKISYKKGKKHGEWLHFLTFTKRGIDLSTIENYEDDLRNGYYYNSDNGFTFTEEGSYKKGKKEGLWLITKGGSKEKILYKDGQKHGKYWRQDASGVIINGQYKKDKKHGNWTIQDLSGNTVQPKDNQNPDSSVKSDITQLHTINNVNLLKGIILKPDKTPVSIAVIRLVINEATCAYDYSDFNGKFSIKTDSTKVTEDSYFEIVIEGHPKKTVPFHGFSNNGSISLDKKGKKITYEEYRAYYESAKNCNL